MDADLDLLLTTVYVTADDLLPESTKNVMRRVTDAEVVTLAVAQAIMGIPSDRRFLAVAGKRLDHLFPVIPKQSGYLKRRRRLTESLEWLMGMFASMSPGFYDDLVLVDSTPVECARSRETVKRSALEDAADYGYCASHSRFFWGSGCTPCSAPMARRVRSSFAPRRSTSARSLSQCSSVSAITRHLQLSLAGNGEHRRVPPADLLLASAARHAGVEIVHYDRDYDRIATVSDLEHRWFVPDGTLRE